MNEATTDAPDVALKLVPHKAEHNLYQRINAVQREVRYVQKDKLVDNKYNVATYDALLDVARNSLIEHGVIVETSLVRGHTVESGGTAQSGKKWIRFEGEFEVRFINMDRPEDRSASIVPAHADDLGDKAPGKAQTYATKAALKKQLLIRTGDEEEIRAGGTLVDTNTGEVTERKRPAAKAADTKVVPMKSGKVASAGEIAFAKTKLKTDENIIAFCTQLGIASLDHLPEGGGKQVSKFLAESA